MSEHAIFGMLSEDDIIDMIRDGDSLRAIARVVGADHTTLHRWLHSDPQRSARVREARTMAAEAFEERASQGIEDAKDAFELAKARELAHHYRWAAKVRNPAQYGDKMNLDVKANITLDNRIAEARKRARSE